MVKSYLNDESMALIKAMLTLNGFERAENKDEWTLKNVPFYGNENVTGDFTFIFDDDRLRYEVFSKKYFPMYANNTRRELFTYWAAPDWGEPSGIVQQLRNEIGNTFGIWLKKN